ncbi:N-acetylmuramoyl-L-alanine amidase [Bacteroides nordii]|uniref:N-acetylmuramoyl-L-alanine amidase n=1 Tax=Bacteroides nordii TaxID=291645 RepID=UPI00047086B8|nr:N-acetylmuramoyl-L-alanine amidase [Bacteroides nordii]UAK42813.1 N-acetylmuramoyl-L-alanine amidase [Bacteroides nordii]
MRKITLIVVHCTASRCTSTLTPAVLDAEHRRRGFTGCGYHYYITKDGTIHPMRDVTLIGAHAKGFNAGSIGIAYEGGLDADGKPDDTRTPVQKESLLILIRRLMAEYATISAVVGHRDLSPDLNGNGIIEPQEWIKICPCFDASAEYRELVMSD